MEYADEMKRYCAKCGEQIPQEKLYAYFKFVRGYIYRPHNAYEKRITYADAYENLVCAHCGYRNKVIFNDEAFVESEVEKIKKKIQHKLLIGFVLWSLGSVGCFFIIKTPDLLYVVAFIIGLIFFVFAVVSWKSYMPSTEIESAILKCKVKEYLDTEESAIQVKDSSQGGDSTKDYEIAKSSTSLELSDISGNQNGTADELYVENESSSNDFEVVDHAQNDDIYLCPYCGMPFEERFFNEYMHHVHSIKDHKELLPLKCNRCGSDSWLDWDLYKRFDNDYPTPWILGKLIYVIIFNVYLFLVMIFLLKGTALVIYVLGSIASIVWCRHFTSKSMAIKKAYIYFIPENSSGVRLDKGRKGSDTSNPPSSNHSKYEVY